MPESEESPNPLNRKGYSPAVDSARLAKSLSVPMPVE